MATNKKTESNAAEGPTSRRVLVLILLWLFILAWLAPLASFAALAVK